MKVRYKNTGRISDSSRFNVSAIDEVLTEDDSAFIAELDVWIEGLQIWKDMGESFRDHDLIIDNYNTYFFEPKTEEDRKRGYTL